MIDGDKESPSENFIRWSIVNVESSTIEVKLHFDSRLEVSSGEKLDYVLVLVNLDKF